MTLMLDIRLIFFLNKKKEGGFNRIGNKLRYPIIPARDTGILTETQ